MQRLKCLLAAAAVVGAGLIATTNFAEAQDYVVTGPDCVRAPPPWRWYKNYLHTDFVPNWGPFFRHHVYRYGPVLVCSAMARRPVIDSKY